MTEKTALGIVFAIIYATLLQKQGIVDNNGYNLIIFTCFSYIAIVNTFILSSYLQGEIKGLGIKLLILASVFTLVSCIVSPLSIPIILGISIYHYYITTVQGVMIRLPFPVKMNLPGHERIPANMESEYVPTNQKLNSINATAEGMELKSITEELLHEINSISEDYERDGYNELIHDDLEYLQERCVDLLDMSKDSFADDREIIQRIKAFSIEFNLEIKRMA